MMLFDIPSDDVLYKALIERDPSYEGFAYVGVKSTGIFCKLTCPARKPKKENSTFYSSIGSALEAGFRPCKRCRPMAIGLTREPMIDKLLDELESNTDKKWSEGAIAEMGFDPSTVRRAFRRQFGITFLEIARQRKIGRSVESLTDGSKVIDAQLTANYDSGSGFRNAISRHIGVSPKNAHNRFYLKADWIETPIGTMIAIADKYSLYLLEFLDRKALPGEMEKLKKITNAEIVMGREAPIDLVEEELNLYFEGRIFHFNTPLAEFGTRFTRGVWDALRKIPMGELRSYSDIAKEIGNTTACRAVARANGANQISILIPCHRVIGADGTLTGYGGGLWRKKWLIEHERRISNK